MEKFVHIHFCLGEIVITLFCKVVNRKTNNVPKIGLLGIRELGIGELGD